MYFFSVDPNIGNCLPLSLLHCKPQKLSTLIVSASGWMPQGTVCHEVSTAGPRGRITSRDLGLPYCCGLFWFEQLSYLGLADRLFKLSSSLTWHLLSSSPIHYSGIDLPPEPHTSISQWVITLPSMTPLPMLPMLPLRKRARERPRTLPRGWAWMRTTASQRARTRW